MEHTKNRAYALYSTSVEQRYQSAAAGLPICDVSCVRRAWDADPQRPYSNIAEWWFRNDPTRQRLLRACFPDEECVSDYDLFAAYCRSMPRLIGNPIYEESHWELKNFFDCDLVINEENCDRIWRMTAERLLHRPITPLSVLADARVVRLCEPCAPWEELPPSCVGSIEMTPVFCPDEAMRGGRADWLKRLDTVSGIRPVDWDSLCAALSVTMDRFEQRGCRMACHTVRLDGFAKPHVYGANRAVTVWANGGLAEREDERTFSMQLLRFFMGEYARRGWVAELRINADEAWQTLFDYASRDRGWAWPTLIVSSCSLRDDAWVGALCDRLRTVATVIDGGTVDPTAWDVSSQIDMLRQYAARTALGSYPGLRTHMSGCGLLWEHERFRRALCYLLDEWGADLGSESKALVEKVCGGNMGRFMAN